MIALTAMMCILLGYQVTMPAVDNAKYTFTVHKDQIIRISIGYVIIFIYKL
jgi:hypothetical protein